MKRLTLLLFVFILGLSSSAFGELNCVEAQKRFAGVNPAAIHGNSSYIVQNWASVQMMFGTPTEVRQTAGRVSGLIYNFRDCGAEFAINSEGKVETKTFRLGNLYTFGAVPTTQQLQPVSSATAQTPDNTETIRSLNSTIQQLKTRIEGLESVIQGLQTGGSPRVVSSAGSLGAPATTPVPADLQRFATLSSTLPKVQPSTQSTSNSMTAVQPSRPATASASTTAVTPGVAENGSYFGEISAATGRPKIVPVDGYYRKDGTYVRGHYRSAPARK